jgi:signal transduction histidine kinase
LKLHTRILLTQLPTVLLLVAVAFYGVFAASRLGESAGRILTDNYRSVLAVERMKEDLERIDSAALFAVAGEALRAEAQIAEYRPRFEAELAVEEGNITEAGEHEAAAELRAAWTDYTAALDTLRGSSPAEARRVYFDDLLPRFTRIKGLEDRVLAMNQDAMARKSDAARELAGRLRQALVLGGIAAVLAALLIGTWATRRLTVPVQALAAGARQVGQGDLDHHLSVHGHDAIAELAAEFNRMTEQLRVYRRSARGELVQAREASQAAIESLLDPVLVFSNRGHLRAANTAARTGIGIGGKSPELVPSAVAATVERACNHVLGGHGPSLPADFSSAVAVGDRSFLPRAMPIYDNTTGELAGVTVVLHDVTRLRRLDELKSDLVHTVAHELRTPLTSLGMAVHLVLDESLTGPLVPKKVELLLTARDDVERLQRLVDDLLDLSRLQEGAVALHREVVPVEALVEAAVGPLRDAARERAITLDCPIGELPPLHVDRERATLVIANLVSNAIRYTAPGGRVTVRAAAVDDGVRVEVEDEGPGVPEPWRERIFDKFTRLPDDAAAGTGLGLSIAREIVHAHGGRIGVEPGARGGARFWVWWPR